MAEYVVSPIKRHLSYAFKCDTVIQTLQNEVGRLKEKQESLQRSVDDATRNGEEIFPNIRRWLFNVGTDIEHAEELIQEKEAKTFSNFKARYQLTKKAEKLALSIMRLYKEGGLDEISFPPQQIHNSGLLPSRVLLLNQIMDALKDPSLNMVGIYGIGGVGKTTLAKEVCARAREDKLFDDVIMISVSRFPNLRRIQAEIASQIYQRLKNAKLLVILDDIWKKLEFHAAGIPFGEEWPGCKLLVSSRRKDVVSGEMGSQKDFLVDVLSGEESWSLLRTTVTPKLEDPRLNAIAVEIVKKCAGLPLLIVLVSLQLKNKELYAWDYKLKQISEFRNEDLHEKVHKVVESSFDKLPEEELKSLFLLCALFAQSNIQIQHLLIYGMGLSLFSTITTIKEARDRLSSLIDKLKNDGLLMNGDLAGHVKLHDVVRDAAISIASRFQNSFGDWPNKNCTRISLPICNIQELPASLECPTAELFLLSSEDLYLEIPALFFEGMAELKVVGFTGIHFPTISLLGCLKNLDTLCFHRCQLDNVSVIGELKLLRFLSFANSEIVELPKELEALTRLRLLDLTNCSKLQVIPTNVLPKLFSLQELYMQNSYVRWEEEGNVRLVELEKLFCLSSLEIQIVDLKLIPKFSRFFNKLSRCTIIIGNGQSCWVKYGSQRLLKLIKLEASIHFIDYFKVLLRPTEILHLDEVSGMQIVLNGLIMEQLENLCIKNDYSIQFLIEMNAGRSSLNAFPLVSMRLYNLYCLEMICDGPLKMFSFWKLQILKISDCGKLKSVFLFPKRGCLWNLREIDVESCENMEALVVGGSEDIDCPRLRSLKLNNLPKLKGICNRKGRAENIGLLFDDKITFFNLTSLELKDCKSLKYVFTRSNVKLLLLLERLEINNCKMLEGIIWHKESEEVDEEDMDKIVLLNLKHVLLKKLTNLKSFSSGFPIEFPSLTEFSIHKCPASDYFSSEKNSSSEEVILYNLDGKRFPRLKSLHIENGYGIRHAVNLNNLNSLESIYFDEMRSLNASNCNKLKNLLYSANCSTQLLEMEVRSCHNIEAIVGGRSHDEITELTQLRSLKLDNLPHLVGFCEQNEGPGPRQLLFDKMVCFPNLTSLVVEKCNSLKCVFTASMVKCLALLKKLEISNCKLLEAIIHINKTEESEEEIINKIVFHQLDALSLHGLPKVKMFACGYEVEFPVLRELSLKCPAMEIFVSKFSDGNNNSNSDENLFNELVTCSNLESMIIRNMDKFRYLWHEKFILDGLFLKLKSLDIANCSRLSVVFPEYTFRNFQKLETLYLSGCDGIEEIFSFEKTEFSEEFSLQDMRIVNLASLKYVFPNTMAYSLLKLEQLEIHNCNVHLIIEEKPLQRVEMLQEVFSTEKLIEFPQLCSLKMKNLPHLTGFCNKREQGFGVQVSFPGLKGLKLCECKNFKYVFTSTMVNSFMQLEKLEISNCELVEEILFSGELDEMDDAEIIEKIVFPKLEYLSLDELPNLNRFDFGYPVEFQSLKELSISYCPMLKNFVSKHSGNECDEYFFNEMVTFSNLERMKVSHTNSFKYLWDERFTVDDSFLKLKSLRIEYCSKLSVVFPSNIYRRFQGLETLYLCCCSRIEEIYQYEGNNFEEQNTVESFSLLDLEIWYLPSLKYIWSKDPPSTFEYLQCVKVVSCKDLMFVFPKSIARRLLQLQHLKISDSHMEVIISSGNVEKSTFIVPRLTILQLENLYQMRNLFKGPYSFKCPKLTQFDLYGFNQAMSFRSEFKSLQLCGFDQMMLGSKDSAYHEEKSLSFVRKEFICNLEELTLDDQGLNLISSVKMGGGFSKLKNVTLRSLHEDSIPLLFGFLRRCSLKKLVFVDSYLEEIFLLDEGEAFQSHFRLKHLEVVGDDSVKHILKKDSRFNPILEKLLTLNVEFCESLFNIAPSAASFKNLTSLNISCCFKMTNLVTISTAKTMTNLMELKVSKCSLMEDIVENDENHDHGNRISFEKLKCLELYDLRTLNSFSLNNSDFYFPLLEQMVMKKCFVMKKFCSGQVMTPKLEAIRFQDELLWKGDLNVTVASQVKSNCA